MVLFLKKHLRLTKEEKEVRIWVWGKKREEFEGVGLSQPHPIIHVQFQLGWEEMIRFWSHRIWICPTNFEVLCICILLSKYNIKGIYWWV